MAFHTVKGRLLYYKRRPFASLAVLLGWMKYRLGLTVWRSALCLYFAYADVASCYGVDGQCGNAFQAELFHDVAAVGYDGRQ